MSKIVEYALSHGRSGQDRSYYGFHRVHDGWVYREWMPQAHEIFLAGEFNGWDWTSHPMFDLGNGSWVLFFPGKDALWEGCKVKLLVDGVPCFPSYGRRKAEDPLGWCAEVTETQPENGCRVFG